MKQMSEVTSNFRQTVDMHVNPTIFREYDIRGIAGKEFTPKALEEYEKWYGKFPGVTINLETAEAIGLAYGTIIRKDGGREIVVGHDVRPFADELTEAFINGVRVAGCDVIDIGVSLTPIVYFTVSYCRLNGGVMVTGSHNIYFYNGFKMMKRDNWPIFGASLQGMRKMIENDGFMKSEIKGSYQKRDGFQDYKSYILEKVKISRPVKVVIDSGNGSAGLFAPNLFRSLGCVVIELFSEPDATYPNHIPDPEQHQYLKALAEKVKETKADLGVAFDADGDRAGFVTEKGECLDSDLVSLVFAKDVLPRFPGKKILFDIKSSALLEELIPKYGGVPLMHRTGHAPIKETMRLDDDVIFAGESSGHFYFVEDYFKIDDGISAAAKMLSVYSAQDKPFGAAQGKPFSELFAEFPKRVRTPEFKLRCSDEKKFEIVVKIQENLAKSFSSLTIDGIRFRVGEKGWGLIRASNTSSYLTVRVEDETESEVLKIKNIIADELEKYPEILDRLNRSEVATLTGKLGWV